MSIRPFTRDVATVASALNSGGVAIVPTDTVYGVAATLLHPAAIERIFAAKGRPADKPIPILVDSHRSARRFMARSCAAADRLTDAFWPGALTLIYPASAAVPEPCLAKDGTVGIRMPAHALLLQLISACGGALAVTSANRSGSAETSAARDAYEALRDGIDIVFDCGALQPGPPSTVVDPAGQRPRIVRGGVISAAEILSVAAAVRR